MIFTPRQGTSLVRDCLPTVRTALENGIDFANHLQPDRQTRDQYYWSHSARFQARQVLLGESGANWSVIEDVPNSGIHLSIGGLTTVRVLRSVGRTTPPPGTNRQRRLAWSQLHLPSIKHPDTLIIDWHTDSEDTLMMGLGLPQGIWQYRSPPQLTWRLQLPSHVDLSDLAFVPDQEADELVQIKVHDTEMDVG